MSLFTDRVDLFFVGKLVLGLGFIKALLDFGNAVLVLLGGHVLSRFLLARSPGLAAVEAAGWAIVCWVGFTLVERAVSDMRKEAPWLGGSCLSTEGSRRGG
jgi:threonine/homoserine efflux transporter RhtA